ncbi:MAG: hypothetical protein WCP57_09930 [Bacteroidota bacterium]
MNEYTKGFCLADNKSYKQAQEVFVSIDNNSLGYAKITAISHIKPSNPYYNIGKINYIQFSLKILVI